MALTRTAPNTFLPVAQGGTTVKQGIVNDDTDIKYILGILSGLSTGKVPYRQTVLTGAVGADGQPSFLVPSGLYVSIAAAAKSLLLSFAAGYGADGYPVDYLSAVSADVANAWNLPPTQTVHLYIDRDASTGTLTYGYTTLEPSYATTKPTTPGTGQAWYNPVLQYMQVYNGSSWDVRQRLYVAKGVTTDAAVVLTYVGLTTDAIINQAVANLTAQYDAISAKYDALNALKWSEKFLMTNPASGYCGHVLSLTRKGTLQNIKFRVQGTVSAATAVNLFAGGSNAITAALDNSATSITVANAPTQTAPYYALLDPYGTPEIVQVTAISGTTLTISRAQCGTTAAAHNSGVISMPIVATVSISAVGVTTYTPSATLTLDEDTLLVYNVSGAGFAAANVSVSAKWGNA